MDLASSKLNGLTIDDSTEYLPVLNGFLAGTMNIVSILGYLNWEHESLLKGLNELFLILFFNDVLDLYSHIAAGLKENFNSLSVFQEIDLFDGVTQVAINSVHPVETEIGCADDVNRAIRVK